MPKVRPFFFTFGQSHAHRYNSVTWDCDLVCVIHATGSAEARQIMWDAFGPKWAMEYPDLQSLDLSYYPRGMCRLKDGLTYTAEDYERDVHGDSDSGTA